MARNQCITSTFTGDLPVLKSNLSTLIAGAINVEAVFNRWGRGFTISTCSCQKKEGLIEPHLYVPVSVATSTYYSAHVTEVRLGVSCEELVIHIIVGDLAVMLVSLINFVLQCACSWHGALV